MINLHVLISKSIERQLKIFFAVVLGWAVMWGSAVATPGSQNIHQRPDAMQRVSDWRSLIVASTQLPDHEKLRRVNEFFNRTIRYGEDVDIWKQADYWASPLETLEKGRGDCEDFALAKFFTLRLLGIPERSLRLVYATQTSTNQAHMVLGYWAASEAEPWLLDNIENEIRPVAQRDDLKAKFAFDELNLYKFNRADLQSVGSVEQLPNWLSLVKKTKREESGLTNYDASGTPPSLLISAVRLEH